MNSGHRTAPPPRSPRTGALLAAVLAGCIIAAGGIYVVSHDSWTPRDATAASEESAPPAEAHQPLAKTVPPNASRLPPTSELAPAPADLASSFDLVAASIGGNAGISMAAVGGSTNPLRFGEWTTGPAWSTSKVPVVLAALREQGAVSGSMNAAITQSDNDAAEQVWASLGDE